MVTLPLPPKNRANISTAQVVLYAFNAHADSPKPAYELELFNFRDPMGRKDLRNKKGTDPEVQSFLKGDIRLPAIIDTVVGLVEDIIGKQKRQYMSIGFRDTHGKLISWGVAEIIADILHERGFAVNVTEVTP